MTPRRLTAGCWNDCAVTRPDFPARVHIARAFRDTWNVIHHSGSHVKVFRSALAIRRARSRTLLASAVLLLSGASAAAAAPVPLRPKRASNSRPDTLQAAVLPADTAPPPIPRELRGVWIATVGNMDWPSRPGLDTWTQQGELLAMLNRAVALHLNAVFFQVRPEADALYASGIEPWSPFLEGEMGRPPEPYYDPLAFLIREAHARGIQVHAWINPYRALDPSSPGAAAPGHVSQSDPDMVHPYGGYLWLDPGDPAVRARVREVVLDIVRRYDVDGIHMDDYFYPYPERSPRGRVLAFPDDSAWARYRATGGRLSRADWRRHNVDTLVEELGDAIHRARSSVLFGISPFGIWRPGNPPGVDGLDPYSELYADSRHWLQEGWVDYLAPQLYWPVGRPQQSFTDLLRWWVSQDVRGRNIWVGLNGALADHTPPAGRGSAELLDQIALTRAQAGASGEILFSMKTLMQDPDSLDERLLRGPYASAAIPPAEPWRAPPPARPVAGARVDTVSGDAVLDLAAGGPGAVQPWLWVIQTRALSGWITTILPGAERQHLLALRGAPAPLDIRVRAVDRDGNMSPELRVAPVPPLPPPPSARVTRHASPPRRLRKPRRPRRVRRR